MSLDPHGHRLGCAVNICFAFGVGLAAGQRFGMLQPVCSGFVWINRATTERS